MKKLSFLILAIVAQLTFAQEARMMNIEVDPYEIEGYGIIEGKIKLIVGTRAPHPGSHEDPNVVIVDKPFKQGTLNMIYTNEETKESRVHKCDALEVEFIIKTLRTFKSLAEDPTSVDLQHTDIVKKTLNPAVVLDDDGVESTYTEEYYCDFNYFTVGVYTNPKGQAVYYYQFGDVKTAAERNTWRILTNETDSFVKWLEIIQKAM